MVAINDQILALSGGAWDRVPEQLTWDLECTERVQRIIADFAPAACFRLERSAHDCHVSRVARAPAGIHRASVYTASAGRGRKPAST